MLDQNDVQIIKDLITEGVRPLEEKISGIEGKVSGIEKEMIKKSEFKKLFMDAMEPFANAIKADFNNLDQKVSTIETLAREIKASSMSEIDLDTRLNRLKTEFDLISREERAIIIKLLKEKKVITEDEAQKIMSIKTFVSQLGNK